MRSRTLWTCTPSRASTAARMAAAWSSSRASTVTSSTTAVVVASTMSRAAMFPPASPMAVASRPSDPGVLPTSTRKRTE